MFVNKCSTAAVTFYVDEGCAFLTENFINLEEVNLNVWSRTICRVLIIPRANYNATCDEFPKDKIIMDRNRASLVSIDCKQSSFSQPTYSLRRAVQLH